MARQGRLLFRLWRLRRREVGKGSSRKPAVLTGTQFINEMFYLLDRAHVPADLRCIKYSEQLTSPSLIPDMNITPPRARGLNS